MLLSFSDFPDKAATAILVLITGEVLFIISIILLKNAGKVSNNR
ncbi:MULTISPECIES: hypothetical protein [Chryseobacterium]